MCQSFIKYAVNVHAHLPNSSRSVLPHSVDREAEALEDAELAYVVTAQWHGPSELKLVASTSFTALLLELSSQAS